MAKTIISINMDPDTGWKTAGGGWAKRTAASRALQHQVDTFRLLDGEAAGVRGDLATPDRKEMIDQGRIDRKNKQLSWFGFGFGLITSMAISGALKGALLRTAVGLGVATAAYWARQRATEFHGGTGAFFQGMTTGSLVGSLISIGIESYNMLHGLGQYLDTVGAAIDSGALTRGLGPMGTVGHLPGAIGDLLYPDPGSWIRWSQFFHP